MRWIARLGSANLALVSAYFAPVWGADAVRVLTSPFNGFEDRVHAAAAIYFRDLFDLGLEGLVRASLALAGIKLLIAAGFTAYVIEFSRSLAMRREPNRETQDIVLVLAVIGIVVWAIPALALDDAGLIRLYATQLLLVAGAVVVLTVEGHIAAATASVSSRVATVERERWMLDAKTARAIQLAAFGTVRRSWLGRLIAMRHGESPAAR